MILYHGTDKIEEIMEGGFIIGESRHTETIEDYVYFSDTEDFAAMHGYVIEVEVSDEYVELYQENPLDEDDFGYVLGDEYRVNKQHLKHIKILTKW